MSHVYLVKLFGMHKIGHTDYFDHRMEQLKPATLIAKKRTKRSRDLRAELPKQSVDGSNPSGGVSHSAGSQ